MTDSDKIFIDTAPFIYLVERHPAFFAPVFSYLAKLISAVKVLFTSVVTYTGFCVKPHENKDYLLIREFEKLLENINCPLLLIDIEIARIAYPLRAKYKFLKASDLFQIAAAINAGCKEFLTNDERLSKIEELTFIQIKDIA